MALSKVNFNSLNVTPAASKAVKFNSNNNGIETGDVGGSLVLISEQTASSSSTISFTSGIDSTYKENQVHFNDVHPASDEQDFQVNFTVGFRDGGTDYDATKTTTAFGAVHDEADSQTSLAYNTASDQAQSTAFLRLSPTGKLGNDNDQDFNGSLHLFDPSNTTFVKHFIARTTYQDYGNGESDDYIAGYCNVTAAIDGVQFKMDSGNIDSGDICLFGIA